MPLIDRFEIEEEIANLLKNDSKISELFNEEVTIEIEPDFTVGAIECPYIGIYLVEEESPPEDELLATTNNFRTYLFVELAIFQWALENREAARTRDKLLAAVKEVIKNNRSINNKVLQTTFNGIAYETGRTDGGAFMKGTYLRLKLEVRE